MKILLSLLMLLHFLGYSQSNDSIAQSKLQQYKTMFTDGLINETEYTKLKQELLFPKEIKEKDKNDFNPKEMRMNSLGQISGGAFLLASGCGLFGMGFNNRFTKLNSLNTKLSNGNLTATQLSQINVEINDIRKRYIIGFTAGSILSASGIILIVFGVHNRQIYLSKKRDVALGISDNNLGLKIRF